jgi:hypothetical protein
LESADEIDPLLNGSGEVSPGRGGLLVPGIAALESSDEGAVSRSLVGRGGSRIRGLKGYSGGVETQESSSALARGNPGRGVWIHRGNKASRRVKLAVRATLSFEIQSDREVGAGLLKGSS